MRMGVDPCRQWAVFRLLDTPQVQKPLNQLSLLISGDYMRLYSCVSLRIKDAAKNSHIVSTGIDLIPALNAQGINSNDLCEEIKDFYFNSSPNSPIPDSIQEPIKLVSKILNISWVADGLENPPQIICPRSNSCPKHTHCENKPKSRKKVSWLNEIKREILTELK
jgi:hypothetical protein